jgi:hypothetical protein
MFGGYAHLKGFFYYVIRFVCLKRDGCICQGDSARQLRNRLIIYILSLSLLRGGGFKIVVE